MTLTDHLREAFDPRPLVEAASLWLPNVLVAIVTLAIFWLVGRGVRRALQLLGHRSAIDVTAISFLDGVVRLGLGTLALVTVLSQLGVDVVGLVAGLGVAGLTVGFAARDALSNIISGLFIFWDRPFVIGDLVEVDGRYGRVEQITLRSTRVVTPDGRMLAFPNATIVNSVVASYTNFPHLRLDVEVTIGTGEDLGRVRRLLLELVESDPGYMADRPPQVVVTELGDWFVRVQLQAWLSNEKEHVLARLSLRERVFETLRASGVDMPNETLVVRAPALQKAAS